MSKAYEPIASRTNSELNNLGREQFPGAAPELELLPDIELNALRSIVTHIRVTAQSKILN